jgi:hypothetical protein
MFFWTKPRIQLLGVMVFVLLVGCTDKCCPICHDSIIPEKIAPRVYCVPRLVGTVLIDGKVEEDAWKYALCLNDFRMRDKLNGSFLDTRSVATTGATVYLAWDDEYLYFAAEIEDEDVAAEVTGRDAQLWVQDVIEIFIKPRKDKYHYYEFEFSPHGDILDIFWLSRGRQQLRSTESFEWNADGIRAASVVEGTLNRTEDRDKGWKMEAVIPLSAFTMTCRSPLPGDEWYFAIGKIDHSAYLERREVSSTTLGAGFHEYESYDILRFVKPKK